MKRLLTILLFFPSVTFSVISAEIAPYALLFSFLYRIWKKKVLIVCTLLVITSVYISFFRYSHFPFDLARSVLAYANVFIIFNIIQKFSSEELTKLTKTISKIFIFLLVFGILQYLGVMSKLGLDPIFQFLIPRGHLTELGGSRGVTLLSSEPSRAGVELVFLYSVIRYNVNRITTRVFLLDIAVFLYVTFVIKSATVLVFISLFLLCCHFILYSVFFSLAIFSLIFFTFIADSRALELLIVLIGSQNIAGLFDIIINTSGFRFISVYAGYLTVIHEVFGYGVGNWEFSSIVAMENTGYNASDFSFFTGRGINDFISLRPTSFVASLSLDFGLIGLFLFLYWFIMNILLHLNKKTMPSVAIFILYAFVVGAIGNPVPWICTAVILGKEYKKKWI